MRTTVNLPRALVLRIKQRAARTRRKLNDEIAALLTAGLQSQPEKVSRRRPKPIRLRGPLPTIEEIEAAINTGRD